MNRYIYYYFSICVLLVGIWPLAGLAYDSQTHFDQPDSSGLKISNGLKKNPVVHIAIESSGDWPPYEYYERKDGEKTGNVKGYNIDVLNMIFNKYGLKYNVRFYPWKRCLKELEIGKNIQMIFPTSMNEKRKKKYHITDVVYTVRPGYVYYQQRDGNASKTAKAQRNS